VARQLDTLDKALIGLLDGNGRLPLAAAAEKVGVSRPTAASHVKALTGDGVLRVAGLIDASRAGNLTTALVGLSLDKFRLDEILQKVADLDEVSWAAVVTGRYDIVAEVITDQGMSGLYAFLNDSLLEVGGIASSEIFVVMKAARKWSSLPRGLLNAWLEPEGG
jgi:Lrp/AsnC family transcriptional regulator for asnA, asnC and gidA